MFDFFNEIVSARFNEYLELLASCPTWFLWVYFGLLAAALIYAILFSKTLNRALWIVFSLAFPLVAFPIEVIQHIVTVKVLKNVYNERRGDKINHRCRVRLRFVLVPATGALLFAIMGGFLGNILPVGVRKIFRHGELPCSVDPFGCGAVFDGAVYCKLSQQPQADQIFLHNSRGRVS